MMTTPTDKRIVLHHVAGRLAGIHSIEGLERNAPHPLQAYVEEVWMMDHRAPASLITVTPRYVLYRELIIPEDSEQKSFDVEQQ